MSSKHSNVSAAQIERRRQNLARRERKDRIWNYVILAIGIIIIITILAIQISHHL